MKKNYFGILFLVITAVLFLANLAIIIVFSAINMEDNFYNSLNVASLSISFLSFIASSFFSLSVYLQSKAQGKINESLPKKDDQYIIANYSLFNIEKEVSIFPVDGDERDMLLNGKKHLASENEENVNDITRLVFLPTDSVNIPTYKVIVKSIGFYSSIGNELYFASALNELNGEYSSNVLQRGYNCICVDIAEDFNRIINTFSESRYIELKLDIISVFNVKMSTKFSIHLNNEKNVDDNPDKNIIHDLRTYNIHHSNYVIEDKSILH